MSQKTLTGSVLKWELMGNSREYLDVSMPFEEAEQYFVAKRFNALTGEGEQRENFEANVNHLDKVMCNGDYTPAGYSAILNLKNKKDVLSVDDATGTATLQLDSKKPLSLINGDHRFSSLKIIRNRALAENNKKVVDEVNSLPISLMIYLNGDAKKDFVNLQMGKKVDSSHLLSMRIHRKLLPLKHQPFAELAFKLAKELNTEKDSPFYKQIRFDTKSLFGLPISSICSRGSSDIATSLFGTAKILHAYEKDEEWGQKIFVKTFKHLITQDLDALKEEHLLTPPPSGTKGSSSMLVGVMSMVVYRCCLEDVSEPDLNMLTDLTESIKNNLSDEVNGNLSGPHKRTYMREFAREFFADVKMKKDDKEVDVEKHEGIPTTLVNMLSASTFGVSPLPKPEKAVKKTKKKKVVTTVESEKTEQLVTVEA